MFIIQGTGRRRWRVGEKVPMKQHCRTRTCFRLIRLKGLLMKSWSQVIFLYPAGFPHEGYSRKLAERFGRFPRAKYAGIN
ncbi:JmjC domain-containing protein [Shigella flexneri]